MASPHRTAGYIAARRQAQRDIYIYASVQCFCAFNDFKHLQPPSVLLSSFCAASVHQSFQLLTTPFCACCAFDSVDIPDDFEPCRAASRHPLTHRYNAVEHPLIDKLLDLFGSDLELFGQVENCVASVFA